MRGRAFHAKAVGGKVIVPRAARWSMCLGQNVESYRK